MISWQLGVLGLTYLFCPNILDDENDEGTTDEFFWLMRFYMSMDEIQTF